MLRAVSAFMTAKARFRVIFPRGRQRAFQAIPDEVREAAWCSGMSHWRTFLAVEFPLAWPGIVSALVLTFAHTMGEFGVVLMMGGNIPGQTQTISIAIYDRVQAFDAHGAATMSGLLLAFSLVAIAAVYMLANRVGRRRSRVIATTLLAMTVGAGLIGPASLGLNVGVYAVTNN